MVVTGYQTWLRSKVDVARGCVYATNATTLGREERSWTRASPVFTGNHSSKSPRNVVKAPYENKNHCTNHVSKKQGRRAQHGCPLPDAVKIPVLYLGTETASQRGEQTKMVLGGQWWNFTLQMFKATTCNIDKALLIEASLKEALTKPYL